MQSIAEEVVSSSGGGGTYITSGFSNYVGHSAIGLVHQIHRIQASGGDYFTGVFIGTLGNVSTGAQMQYVTGLGLGLSGNSPKTFEADYFLYPASSEHTAFIVF